jgi:hypothetical protein
MRVHGRSKVLASADAERGVVASRLRGAAIWAAHGALIGINACYTLIAASNVRRAQTALVACDSKDRHETKAVLSLAASISRALSDPQDRDSTAS